jgi:hypothetical protein
MRRHFVSPLSYLRETPISMTAKQCHCRRKRFELFAQGAQSDSMNILLRSTSNVNEMDK